MSNLNHGELPAGLSMSPVLIAGTDSCSDETPCLEQIHAGSTRGLEIVDSQLYPIGTPARNASREWTALLHSAQIASHATTYSVSLIPAEGALQFVPLLVADDKDIDKEQDKDKDKDVSLGSGELDGPRKSDSAYYGPSYKYEFDKHEVIDESMENKGFSVEHKFRQWIKITWNEIKGGKPSTATGMYEGWDHPNLVKKYGLNMLQNRKGNIGKKWGWVPADIVAGGDFPSLDPMHGAWMNGLKKGDKLQILFQCYTLRCGRIVQKKDKKVVYAGKWSVCGRWCWWVLLIFISGGPDSEGKGTVKGTDSKSGKGKADGTGGRPPKDVLQSCGVKETDVLCNKKKLIKQLSCESA